MNRVWRVDLEVLARAVPTQPRRPGGFPPRRSGVPALRPRVGILLVLLAVVLECLSIGTAAATPLGTSRRLLSGWVQETPAAASVQPAALTPGRDGGLQLDVKLEPAPPTVPGASSACATFWHPLNAPGKPGLDLQEQRLVMVLELPISPVNVARQPSRLSLETVVRMDDGSGGTTEVSMAFTAPRGGGTLELSMPLTPATWQRTAWWAQEDRRVQVHGLPVAPRSVTAIGLRIEALNLKDPLALPIQLLQVELLPVVSAQPVSPDAFVAASGINALWGHPDPHLDKLGHWVGSTLERSLGYAQHRAYLHRLFTDLRRSGYRLARVPLFHDLGGDTVVRDDHGFITGFADAQKVHADVAALLEEAAGAGIQLVPVLVSFEVADGKDVESPQDFADARGRDAFIRQVVLPIAEQLADPSYTHTVAALDLFNEPDGQLAVALSIGAFQAYIRESLPAIHALPGVPPRLTVGFQKLSNLARFGTRLGLDLLQSHSYQDGRFSDPLTDNLGQYGLGASLGKPVVMWELGASHGEPALQRIVETLHTSGFSGVAFYGDDKRFVVPPYAASTLTRLSSAADAPASTPSSGTSWAVNALPGAPAAEAALPVGFPRIPGLTRASATTTRSTVCVYLFDAELGTPRYGKPSAANPDGTCGPRPLEADATLTFTGALQADGSAQVDPASGFSWLLHEVVYRARVAVLDDAGAALLVSFPTLHVDAVRRYEPTSSGLFNNVSWQETVSMVPDAAQAAAVEVLRALVGHEHRPIDALLLAAQQLESRIAQAGAPGVPQVPGAGDSASMASTPLETRLPDGFAELIQGLQALQLPRPDAPSQPQRGLLLSWIPRIVAEVTTADDLPHFNASFERLSRALAPLSTPGDRLESNPAALGQLVTWSWQFARSPLQSQLMTALDRLYSSPVVQAEMQVLSQPQTPVPLEQRVEETAYFLWGGADALARGTQTLEELEAPIRLGVNLLWSRTNTPARLLPPTKRSSLVLAAAGGLLALLALSGLALGRHSRLKAGPSFLKPFRQEAGPVEVREAGGAQ